MTNVINRVKWVLSLDNAGKLQKSVWNLQSFVLKGCLSISILCLWDNMFLLIWAEKDTFKYLCTKCLRVTYPLCNMQSCWSNTQVQQMDKAGQMIVITLQQMLQPWDHLTQVQQLENSRLTMCVHLTLIKYIILTKRHDLTIL